MLEGVTDVGWMDGLQVGTFPLRDIVARVDDIRRAPLSCLYWWTDHVIKDKEC